MGEFVDLSYANGGVTSFAAAKASGIEAVALKSCGFQVSLGQPYVDSKYVGFADAARAAGLGVIHYGFNGNSVTPTAAAQFFVAHLRGYTGNDGLAWDVEADGPQNFAWTPDQVNEAMDVVHQELGRYPDFYTYRSMLTAHDWTDTAKRSRLWLASPTPTVDAQPYFGMPALWQYSQRWVPGLGTVDADRTVGAATWNNVAAAVPPRNDWLDWSKR